MSQNKMFQTHTDILEDIDTQNIDLIDNLMNEDDNPIKKMEIEGFVGYKLPEGVNPKLTHYEETSWNTYDKTRMSYKQIKDMEDMKKQYNFLVDKYNALYENYKEEVKTSISRIDSGNKFLNKNILLDGHYGNVTNLGTVEWYNSKADFDNTVGKNGCPASNNISNVDNIKWDNKMLQSGTNLPTNPKLYVANRKATAGQSCGFEGSNVYVSSISKSNNASVYQGCYGDKAESRAMTLLNNTPVTFDECQDIAQRGSYKYFGLQDYSNGKAKCYGSNSLDNAKKYGDASKIYEDTVILSLGDGKANSAKMDIDGKLKVYDSAGNVIAGNKHGQYVIFYEGSGYTGKETWVTVGSYGEMYKANLSNNSIRSIKVPKGLSVILYMQNYYKSTSVTLGPGDYPNLNTLKETTAKFDKATSSMKIFATDGYFLDLANNGNVCIYAGKKDVYTTYQGVWCSNTNGKAVGTGNPLRVASKGKYGRNYLKQGEVLNKGEWIGSLSGTAYLMLTNDGYLKLITPGNTYSKCIKGADNKLYGKVNEANAIYSNENMGDPSLIGKIGFIDSNSMLSEYPSSMTGKLGSTYLMYGNSNSDGNTIKTITNTTVNNCKTKCNQDDNCGGFVFNKNTNNCNLKSTKTFPVDKRKFSSGVDMYVRNRIISNDETCNKNINYIDSNQWKNYVKSGKMMTSTTNCGLLNSVSTYQNQLEDLKKQIDVLAQKIETKNTDLKIKQGNAINQINKNFSDFSNSKNDYKEIVKYNAEQQNYLDGMLDDSRLVMLQQNQKYILWSVLTIGSVVVAVNLSK